MAMATHSDYRQAKSSQIPFDAERLDRLLEEADVDLLVVTSKHNIQCLLGGYRFIFFDYMDALGASRYLPILIYRKGRIEDCAYIGHRLEVFEKELGRFWPPFVETKSNGSTDAMKIAVEQLKRLGGRFHRIGIEAPLLPVDAHAVLTHGLGNVEIVDASFTLDRLRTRKTPAELVLLRERLTAISRLPLFGKQLISVLGTADVQAGRADGLPWVKKRSFLPSLNFRFAL